jgi:hypothetical protein
VYDKTTDSIKCRTTSSFTDRAKNAFNSLFGSDSKNSLSHIKTSTTGHILSKHKTTHKVKYTVKVSLSELCVNLGNILSSIDNKSLIDVLKITDVVLEVGDIIELAFQKDPSLNDFYEIVSIGSSDEPWVLSIVP